MALTALDPTTAVLVVDLQKGLIGTATLHPMHDVAERAGALIAAFRRHRLPVVLINVSGVAPGRTEQARRLPEVLPAGFTEFLPELGQQPDDIVITKQTWGAFARTDLEARLRALGVTQVVVAGVATGTGVESTARQAYEAGFNVTLAIDAMTDARPEAHAFSLRHVFPRLGETGTTQDIIDLLAKRSA
ncbi:isochorismatase family cysteine hydrolase [Xanthobacter sp. VNH20]|uniref:isochorismatase family cysteine hydrolase n=1 Tax=Xanthobacter sp. VNH20 TaxID=3156616 RepID=UPI0032B59351